MSRKKSVKHHIHSFFLFRSEKVTDFLFSSSKNESFKYLDYSKTFCQNHFQYDRLFFLLLKSQKLVHH